MDAIMRDMIEKADRERRLIRWADDQLALERASGGYRLTPVSDSYHGSRQITGTPENHARIVRAHDTSADHRTSGPASSAGIEGAVTIRYADGGTDIRMARDLRAAKGRRREQTPAVQAEVARLMADSTQADYD